MQVVIPMAGLGSRFSKIGVLDPKPLIRVQDKTLIEHSVKSFDVDAKFIFITRRFDDPRHNAQLSNMLKSLKPNSIEIVLDNLTNGASQTVLAAKEYINNSEPLVVYNCDQIIKWNPHDFLDFVKTKPCDGAIVLYNSNDPKNSFAEVNPVGRRISRLIEKQVISNNALIGFHYWTKGKDFVESAEKLVDHFHTSGQPECYVSETYNYLIQDDKVILPYFISNNMYIPLGTPEDVAKYLGTMREYYSEKPKTIFCDIDGTLVKHQHAISDVLMSDKAEILPDVRTKINQWDSLGHKIVLVTARKESTRATTEEQLRSLGIAWDQLVMGVTSGQRVLINDKLYQDDVDRANAVNVITDEGFEKTDWTRYGL